MRKYKIKIETLSLECQKKCCASCRFLKYAECILFKKQMEAYYEIGGYGEQIFIGYLRCEECLKCEVPR